jgi:hypothetical protein
MAHKVIIAISLILINLSLSYLLMILNGLPDLHWLFICVRVVLVTILIMQILAATGIVKITSQARNKY